MVFFFASRRPHTRCGRDWSSDVCSSDLKVADYIIDVGPEGGRLGGRIVGEGTPEQLVKKSKDSITAKYLKTEDRKSTRLNSSHVRISYAVFCLKKKKTTQTTHRQVNMKQ